MHEIMGCYLIEVRHAFVHVGPLKDPAWNPLTTVHPDEPCAACLQAWYAFNEIVVGGVVINHVPSMRIDAQARLP